MEFNLFYLVLDNFCTPLFTKATVTVHRDLSK